MIIAQFAAVFALAGSSLAAPVEPRQSFVLTKEYARQTLEALAKELDDRYVDPVVAKKIGAELRRRIEAGDFDAPGSGNEFAAKVNELLRTLVTDAHLRFRFSEQTLPPRAAPAEPSAEELRRNREEVRFSNAGFDRIERLRGNVGYISFRGFQSRSEMARPAAAAFSFLSDTDALIVDLRQNGGGHPAGVQLFCSYLFGPKPVHLNSIYFRPTNETTEFWTLEKLDGPRYLDKPVYVLTSKRTGSGAEECAYNLKNLKRATLVGTSTWGGANPGGVVRLNDHFACFIPVGRAINPYTKTNWEGTGVLPDVEVDSAKALKHAQVLAIKSLIEATKSADRKADLAQILREVEAEPDR